MRRGRTNTPPGRNFGQYLRSIVETHYSHPWDIVLVGQMPGKRDVDLFMCFSLTMIDLRGKNK